MNSIPFKCALAAAALSLAAQSANVAALQLMRVPGIPGDSTVDGYKDWIPIDSVQAAVVNGGCSQVTVTKSHDAASLLLIAAASAGDLLDPVEIVNLAPTPPEGKLMETFNVALVPARIADLSLSGGSDGRLNESLSFDTGALVFNYGDGPKEFSVPCARLKK